MKKRVLITGATGFVGFHLIEAALAADMEVYANIRQSSKVDHLQHFAINFVELDFESIYALTAHISEYRYDYIIHAAGVTKAESLAEYNRFNASYTRNLAIAATSAAHRIEKFIFVSSLAALGPLDDAASLLEDSGASNPVTYYGKSKLLAESYLSNIPLLPLIVFRPTAVYGPREREILIVLKAIKRGIEVYLGKREQQLSFVYVKDLAEIMVSALKSDVTGKAYNVSDGEVYGRSSLADYTKAVLLKKTLKVKFPLGVLKGLAWSLEKGFKLFNKVPTLNIDKVNELTGVNWACNIENIKKDLGFKPRYQLEQGLSETIDWYQHNNWL